MLIDVAALWYYCRGELIRWYFPALLLTYFVYLRWVARLSFLKSLAADLAMTALFPVAILLSLLAWALFALAIPAISAPTSATPISFILALLISALTSTAFQSALLRGFKHRFTKRSFWLVMVANTIYLFLASYRTVSIALAHPPEA